MASFRRECPYAVVVLLINDRFDRFMAGVTIDPPGTRSQEREVAVMDATKLDAARAALTAKREEVGTELERLDAEIAAYGAEQETERGGVGNHLAEDGSNVEGQERLLTISGDLRDIMVQVEEALERLDEGTYGTCARCGQPINPERLEAFPYVAYCIECQTIVERQRQNRLTMTSAR